MKIIEISIVCIYIGLYVVCIPRILFKRDLVSLKLLLVEIVLQNFVCILAGNFLSGIWIQLIILYKEFVMYGCVLISFVLSRKKKIDKSQAPIFMMILLCIPYLFIGNADMYTRFVCLRQIMTPVILILYGFSLKISKDDLHELLKYVVLLGIVQAGIGLLELLVLGDEFWLDINIAQYMENKGFSRWAFENGLPGNFYSYDLYLIIGRVRRLAGLAADPLLTGHYLAFCVVILLYINVFKTKVGKNFALILITISTILTLSKGALLIMVIAYWYKIYRHKKYIAIVSSVVPVAIIFSIISSNSLSTVSRHINGLFSSLSTGLIGGGLGTSGNYASLYGGQSSSSGESYFGAVIGQMGFIGFGMFIFMMFKLLKKLLDKYQNSIGYSIFAYMIALMVEALTAESAINFVGSGVAFIILGIMLNSYNIKSMMIKR